MYSIRRLGLLLVLMGCPIGLSAADEPAGELQPLAPLTRSLLPAEYANRGFNNNTSMMLSPDGKTLVVAINNMLNVWDLAVRQTQPRSLEIADFAFQNAILSLAPDGKTLAAVSQNGGSGLAVQFFDLATGKVAREIENDQALSGLAHSPDGRLLAVGTPQRVELWDAANGDEVRLFPVAENAGFHALAFSPDGKMLAAVGALNPNAPNVEANVLFVWETASGKERLRLKPAVGPAINDPRVGLVSNNSLSALAFSADSRLLAAAGSDGVVRLWDLLGGAELPPLSGARGVPVALLFPPDGKEVVALDADGTRLSWKLSQVRKNGRGRLEPLDAADFAELWDDLGESDAFRVYRARRGLAADPARTLPLLRRHVQPVPPGDLTRINRLITDLSNTNGGTRRKAMMELRTKHGEAALGALSSLPPEAMNNQAVQVLHNKLQALYTTPERTRAVKAVGVLEEIATPEARQLLEKLSKGAGGVGLTTEAKAALDRLAAARKVSARPPSDDELWSELANEDAARAFAAVRSLSLRPPQAVALLRKHLRAVPLAEDKRVVRLIADLESDDFKTREQANGELEKFGEQVLPALRKALTDKPSLEARKRIDRLIEQFTQQMSPPALRMLRAVEVLEHVATPEARQVLQTLAAGAPAARLTGEAKASLRRLAHQ